MHSGRGMMRKPDFFIVGAPKCGTTALYEYLRPHPNVFMSTVKEPHFFAKDLGSYPHIKTDEEYAALFAGANEQHLRVGEASVYYLRSAVAIPNIREFNPDARLIAMFRFVVIADETRGFIDAGFRGIDGADGYGVGVVVVRA